MGTSFNIIMTSHVFQISLYVFILPLCRYGAKRDRILSNGLKQQKKTVLVYRKSVFDGMTFYRNNEEFDNICIAVTSKNNNE